MPESRGERGARGAVVQGGRSHAVLAAAAVPSRQAGVVSSRLPQGAAGGGLAQTPQARKACFGYIGFGNPHWICYGHTIHNTPDPIRTPKLSWIGLD